MRWYRCTCGERVIIAAPAAIQASIPDPNIGLAMLAALRITFPIDLLSGLTNREKWVKLV